LSSVRGGVMSTHTIPPIAFRRLHRLGFPSYGAYLRSPQWKAVVWRYRHSRLPQRCAVCGDRQTMLHHRNYNRIGNERLGDLIPLCQAHHDQQHQFQRQSK
jgi:hypothetical protein